MERWVAIEELVRDAGVGFRLGAGTRAGSGDPALPVASPPRTPCRRPPPDSLREVDRMVGCMALFAGVLPTLGALLDGGRLGGEATLALLVGLTVWWLLEH